MLSKADSMVAAARDCLETPFHHQGRHPKQGLDCIGLVIVALKAVGADVQDRNDYGRRPDGKTLIAGLEEHGAQQVQEMQKGDVLVFRYDHQPQHVAIATSQTQMIHSFAPVGKVVETRIGAYWRRRLVSIYRFYFLEEA